MISNGNIGVDIITEFSLQAFHPDAKDHPEDVPPRPLMCMTGLLPQLESAALAGAFGSEGCIASRILYTAMSCWMHLFPDKAIMNDPSTRVVAAKAIFFRWQLRIGIF
jgi:hypothetical protein